MPVDLLPDSVNLRISFVWHFANAFQDAQKPVGAHQDVCIDEEVAGEASMLQMCWEAFVFVDPLPPIFCGPQNQEEGRRQTQRVVGWGDRVLGCSAAPFIFVFRLSMWSNVSCSSWESGCSVIKATLKGATTVKHSIERAGSSIEAPEVPSQPNQGPVSQYLRSWVRALHVCTRIGMFGQNSV